MAAGDADAEERLEREIQRIAEDSRRRRREIEERLMREAEEEQRRLQQEQEAQDRSSQRVDRSKEGGTSVPELERAVKVRWVREGRGLELDKDSLIPLFSPFGKIENTFMLKDKRLRIGDKREKKIVATGVVVFTSIREEEESRRGRLAVIESVFWASGNEPDLGMHDSPSPAPSPHATADTADSKPSTPSTNGKPSFDFSSLKDRGTPLKNAGRAPPSFSSFSPAAAANRGPSSSTSGRKACLGNSKSGGGDSDAFEKRPTREGAQGFGGTTPEGGRGCRRCSCS
ncbi:Cell cycle control protein (Cwf23) [Rasamsonia emersonii CBS 393.64]|uniref:Cell cycle control protein (Cwf23) n=1 Tax=Rasamsonia emersonii (strain ATCC 16479 / CBS 393.64 / IMI 116815) TaxID=1408163 RepID=A0A0F4YHF4_RASE3|nr:Cell cycle control protein (Cwf23) [Rasamsonia emersonii CBS 393.64]KKA17530.1 Cell cycle control protein (Cwf23) [Rasamsonia emersonii CBS 393.64]